MSHASRVLTAALLVLFAAPEAARSAAKPESSPPKEKTYTVEPGMLKVKVTLDGVFEARKMTPVSRTPKAWSQMKVLWAVKPGAKVEQGEPLVRLDAEDLDKKIEDIEAGEALAGLGLKQATEELRLLEESAPEQLKWAQRSKSTADENFEHYKKSDLAYKDKHLALDKEGINLWLESNKMEMEELKKMYEADDLVEGTEELVLKREQHSLKRTQLDYEEKTKFEFPWRNKVEKRRELEQQKKKVRDAEAALDQTETMVPIKLRRKQLEVKKMEYDRARAREHLEELKADRETMTIRAPADGVVYYGECVRGRYPSAEKIAEALKPGGGLPARQVFITIVEPGPVFVRAAAPEKNLHDLRRGQAATVTPTAYPKHKLTGEVESVKIAPAGPAPYSVTVTLDDKQGPVLPGMTCKVELLAYQKKDALLVPAAAVFSEPADEDARYVYLQKAEGEEPLKQPVIVGRRKGDKLEVLYGLTKGDVVLLTKPGE